MKFAVMLTVEDCFILEVEAPNKEEAEKRVDRFIESEDLVVTNQEDLLPVRTAK